jgi:site-specific DNA-methyltransferase (adenine-specific)
MPRDNTEPPAALGTWHLEQGDCVEVMKRWAEEGVQVSAIVTDPPFHLTSVVKRFGNMTADTKGIVAERTRTRADGAARLAAGMMGMLWDGNEEGKLPVAFDPATWVAALALLKPGGRLAAFGSTRTHHRMVCAIEDAGFEIEDTIVWCFGQGLVLRRSRLNPGWSPIVLARAPGPVLDLGIEACRVPHRTVADGNLALNPHLRDHINGGNGGIATLRETERRVVTPSRTGRWPKNLVTSGEIDHLFPSAPGQIAAERRDDGNKSNQGVYGAMKRAGHTDGQPRPDNGRTGEATAQTRYADRGGTNFAATPGERRHDTGSAARFFNACPYTEEDEADLILTYQAKIRSADKVYRCMVCDRPIANEEMKDHRHAMMDWRHVVAHPTQKSLSLLKWILLLIAKPGDVILDPFCGTATTLKAAVREGMDALGIEQSGEYCSAARFRMSRL